MTLASASTIAEPRNVADTGAGAEVAMIRLSRDGRVVQRRGSAEAGGWRVPPFAPDGTWRALTPWCDVQCVASGATQLRIRRAPDTCADLYFMEWQQALYVSTQLRELVQVLPPEARQISDATRAYVRAFRALPYAHAIVGPIVRVQLFEAVVAVAGEQHRPITVQRSMQAMQVEPTIDTVEQGAQDVSEALRVVVERDGASAHMRLLLSGGVDSTLLATYYTGTPVRYAVTVPSFPEYAAETEYARDAARLLGVSLDLVPAPAPDLQSLLEEAVLGSLQPPNHTQTVLLYAAFRSEPSTYITAQFADALFGFGRSVTGYAAQRLDSLLSIAALVPAAVLPSRVRSALRVRDALRRSPGNVRSWTATYARYLGADAAERIVGAEMLGILSHERADATAASYPGPVPAAVDRHMAFGQWLDYVHDDAIAIWSAMAQHVGSRLVAPYHSRELIASAHRIRMPLRVSGGGQAKPVLRHLLGARLPGYSLTKSKLASGLPMERMVREGYPDLMQDALSSEADVLRLPGGEQDPEWAEAVWSVLAARLWERAVAQLPAVPDHITTP